MDKDRAKSKISSGADSEQEEELYYDNEEQDEKRREWFEENHRQIEALYTRTGITRRYEEAQREAKRRRAEAEEARRNLQRWREEAEEARRKQVELEIAKVQPYLEKFVLAQFPPTPFGLPPIHFVDEQTVNISGAKEEQLRALYTFLRNKGFDAEIDDMLAACQDLFVKETKRRILERFAASNPHLGSSPSAAEAGQAIRQTFGESPSAIALFAFGLEIPLANAQAMVEEARVREREQRHLSEIEAIMNGTHRFQTVITIEDVDGLSGRAFEHLLCHLFRQLKYDANVTQASGDQGADLLIEKRDERIAVQAKCYAQAVTNGAIQEVVASVAFYHASRAMVVTNSTFTRSAYSLAEANGVELWDREVLAERLEEVALPASLLEEFEEERLE